MDYHLEKDIRLNTESENEVLYSWYLQECDKDGKTIGPKQVPWAWDLIFTASELRYSTSIKLEDQNSDEESEGLKDSELITATLHSGYCSDGETLDQEVNYSMFGTDRKLNDFTLRIYKLDDDESDEGCQVYGVVSYTAEIDFYYETEDDVIEINLMLKPKRFNTIAELIKAKALDIVTLRLGYVDGFYSEWSPSIRTDSIKILAKGDEQKVIRGDDNDISPPRLGEVMEFHLSITQRCKLNPKQDLKDIEPAHKLKFSS